MALILFANSVEGGAPFNGFVKNLASVISTFAGLLGIMVGYECLIRPVWFPNSRSRGASTEEVDPFNFKGAGALDAGGAL